MHLLCRISMFLITFLSYYSYAFTVTCNTPITIKVKVRATLSCKYSIANADVIGFYWKIGDDFILRLEGGTRRGGSRLGVFNISDDGAMIMIDPQYSDSNLYTFLVVSRSSGNQNANLKVLVTDLSSQYKTTRTPSMPPVTLDKVSAVQTTTTQSEQKKGNGIVIAVITILCVLFASLIIISIICWRRRKKRKQKRPQRQEEPIGQNNEQYQPIIKIESKATNDSEEAEKKPKKELSLEQKVLAEVKKTLQKTISITDAEVTIHHKWKANNEKENMETYLDWLGQRIQEHTRDEKLHRGFIDIILCAMTTRLNQNTEEEVLLSVDTFTVQLQNMLRKNQIDVSCFIDTLFEVLKGEKMKIGDYFKAIEVQDIHDQLYIVMKATWRLEKIYPGEGKKHWLQIKEDPKCAPDDFLRVIGILFKEKELENKECRMQLLSLIKGDKSKEDEVITTKACRIYLDFSESPDEFFRLTTDLKNKKGLTPEDIFSYLFYGRKANMLTSKGYENGVDELLQHKTINKKSVKQLIIDRKGEKMTELFKEALYPVLRTVEEEKIPLSEIDDFLSVISEEIRYKTKEMTLHMRDWLKEKKLSGRTVIKMFYWLIIEATSEKKLPKGRAENKMNRQISDKFLRELTDIVKITEDKLGLEQELKAIFNEIKDDIKGTWKINNWYKIDRQDEHKRFVNLLYSQSIIDETLKVKLTNFDKEVAPKEDDGREESLNLQEQEDNNGTDEKINLKGGDDPLDTEETLNLKEEDDHPREEMPISKEVRNLSHTEN